MVESLIALTDYRCLKDIERRRSIRFSIERDIRYKTLNQRLEIVTGIGKTQNISSSGVLFTSDLRIPVGTRLEVVISWPVQLNDRCLLNLVVRGLVTRHEKGKLALEIQHHEFRTQSLPAMAVGAVSRSCGVSREGPVRKFRA